MSRALIIYDTKFGNTACMHDLLAIGGPTHMLGLSKPMKDFLQKLEDVNISGKRAFAFDTKLKSRFAGSAGKRIEKKLKKLGTSIVKSHVSAIVKGNEGPLEDGAEETFEQIGADTAKSLQ